MEDKVLKDNEEHNTRLKPVEDKINSYMEKYGFNIEQFR
jgi:hypothetical protein